jgi:hypothetical protein
MNYYTIQPSEIFQGTSYSSWQPDGLTNNKIIVDTGIQSNWKYRQYIQKNANEIMKFNSMQAIHDSGNNPHILVNNSSTGNTPHLYNSIHDTNNPSYGFRNSDLKQNYMDKIQMKSRMIAPSIPTKYT